MGADDKKHEIAMILATMSNEDRRLFLLTLCDNLRNGEDFVNEIAWLVVQKGDDLRAYNIIQQTA